MVCDFEKNNLDWFPWEFNLVVKLQPTMSWGAILGYLDRVARIERCKEILAKERKTSLFPWLISLIKPIRGQVNSVGLGFPWWLVSLGSSQRRECHQKPSNGRGRNINTFSNDLATVTILKKLMKKIEVEKLWKFRNVLNKTWYLFTMPSGNR